MSRAIDHFKVSLLHIMKSPVCSLDTCKVSGGVHTPMHMHVGMHTNTHTQKSSIGKTLIKSMEEERDEEADRWMD